MEGLTRSFFIAAPLVANRPEAKAGGYSLAEYYKYQVLRSCTKLRPLYNAAGEDESYVGTYEELQAICHTEDPYCCYQQTVETCALVICLWISREQIWDTYTREEKDAIAAFLTSYAHHATVPQNWRLFNMLDMAFLHMEGYPIDEAIMREHAQAILNYYVGEGWYRDGHSFDYYSCWAFNMYAPLWNLWYGYENMPYVAARFEAHSNELMKTYGDFFDRDGWTNMWGRSNVYRFAAVSAFDGNLLMPGGQADPGRARRIASGSLLQFLGREDFYKTGFPRWDSTDSFLLWCRATPARSLLLAGKGFPVSAPAERTSLLDGEGEQWNLGAAGKRSGKGDHPGRARPVLFQPWRQWRDHSAQWQGSEKQRGSSWHVELFQAVL